MVEVIIKGAQTTAYVNIPRLGNMRVAIKAARYSPIVLHAFNEGDTLPTASMGRYASHLYSMLAGPMSEAFVRHHSVPYARGVWPRVNS